MATKKEVDEHLKIALLEIGEVKPWFDEEVDAWIFSHRFYPVEYGGKTAKEVIRNYPKYLREFIQQRLNNNLSPIVNKVTKGRGGKRVGAGRPVGTKKAPTITIRVHKEIGQWIKANQAEVQQLITGEKKIVKVRHPKN